MDAESTSVGATSGRMFPTSAVEGPAGAGRSRARSIRMGWFPAEAVSRAQRDLTRSQAALTAAIVSTEPPCLDGGLDAGFRDGQREAPPAPPRPSAKDWA